MVQVKKNIQMQTQKNNPLHGKTLEMILNELVAHYGWESLGSMINIRCFQYEPSVKSSLTFLRKTPWARTKVEELYVWSLDDLAKDWFHPFLLQVVAGICFILF